MSPHISTHLLSMLLGQQSMSVSQSSRISHLFDVCRHDNRVWHECMRIQATILSIPQCARAQDSENNPSSFHIFTKFRPDSEDLFYRPWVQRAVPIASFIDNTRVYSSSIAISSYAPINFIGNEDLVRFPAISQPIIQMLIETPLIIQA